MNDELQRRDLLAWAGAAACLCTMPAHADDKPRHVPLERVALDAPLGQTADGKPVTLADFSGKPVVVVFWASWCPHCRRELPDIERLQLAAGERIRVVAVNNEDRLVFRKLNRALSSYKMLLTHDAKNESGKAFGAPGSVPYTMLIRTDGTVAATQSGWGDDSLNYMAREVDAALKAAQPTEG